MNSNAKEYNSQYWDSILFGLVPCIHIDQLGIINSSSFIIITLLLLLLPLLLLLLLIIIGDNIIERHNNKLEKLIDVASV